MEIVGRVPARRMDRCEQFALVAAREAWADAGTPEVDPERLGVTVTTGIGGIGSILAAYDTLKEKGWQRISPFTVPMLMPNGSAAAISMEVNARAGAHSVVSACASGAEAIGYGIDMIRSGRADVVLAGGTEAAIMPLNIGALRGHAGHVHPQRRAGAGLTAVRQGPGRLRARRGRRACWCWSRCRTHSSAAPRCTPSRRAPVTPPTRITSPHPAPDGAGVTAAIGRALADAHVDPTQVVHLNAHATSTPEGDPVEAQALIKALGPAADGVIVSATKSMTGHLLGGAGAIESIAAIMALRDRTAPPTINLEDIDEDITIDVATEPRPLHQARIRADGGAEQLVRVRRAQRIPGVHQRLISSLTHRRLS